MTTNKTAQAMALIAAAMARIEGMKAANAEREANGDAQAYGADEFFYEAHSLETIARDVLEQ